MTDTQPAKRRGRPRTDSPLSSTERSQRFRDQVTEVMDCAFRPNRPLERFSDSVLLMAFTQSYRQRVAVYTEAIGRELYQRLGVSVDFVAATKKDEGGLTVAATKNDSGMIPVAATKKGDSGLTVATTENGISVAATKNSISVAATKNARDELTVATTEKPVSVATTKTPDSGLTVAATEKERGYPADIKLLAVKMSDDGKPSAEIRAAILDQCGRAPSVGNVAKLTRQWRAALQ